MINWTLFLLSSSPSSGTRPPFGRGRGWEWRCRRPSSRLQTSRTTATKPTSCPDCGLQMRVVKKIETFQKKNQMAWRKFTANIGFQRYCDFSRFRSVLHPGSSCLETFPISSSPHVDHSVYSNRLHHSHLHDFMSPEFSVSNHIF